MNTNESRFHVVLRPAIVQIVRTAGTPFGCARTREQEVDMRTSLCVTLVAGAVLLLGSATPARANEVCRITVPFAFVVNGQTLPSGEYDVRTDDLDPGILTIAERGHGRAYALVSTVPDDRPAPGRAPALTFVRSGSEYRLATVWEGAAYGREVIVR
jgi:hypothetical protein